MSLLKRIKRLNPVSHSLHLAGVGTTMAGVMGVYHYIQHETQSLEMSIAFAGTLGIVIYLGWEIAFNSEKIKRQLAAGILAIAASTASAYTVYENSQMITYQQAVNEIKTRQNRLDQADQQTRNDRLKRQDQLELDNKELKTINQADLQRIAALDGKSKEWREATIRKEIADRERKIASNNQELKQLSEQLTKQNARALDVPKPEFNLMRLIRAGMFEGLTLVCLLFASWTRQEKQASEAKQVAAIEAVITKASAALVSLEMALAASHEAKQAAISDLTQAAQALTTDTQQQLEQSAQRINTATAELLDIKKAAISDLATYHERLRTETEQAALLQHTLSKAATEAVAAYKNAENVTTLLNETVQNANQLQTALADLNNTTEQKQGDLSNLIQVAVESNSRLENTHVTAIRVLSNLHLQIETAQNCKSPFAPAFAPANQGVQISGAEQEGKFTKADLIFALKNHLIEPNERNRLPVDYLKNKTGLGKPSIQEVLEESAKSGVLINTGNGYTYATEPQTASPLVHSNVISLRGK